MDLLSFIEKRSICRLFGISDGYVFKYWSDRGQYKKDITRQLILESCGIDIYNDKPYKDLSQQKCVEKIWATGSPQMIAKLLSTLSEYFCLQMGTDYWTDDDSYDYRKVKDIIRRLRSTQRVSLPQQESYDIKLIISDIEANVSAGKPELVIDRLHTFSTKYIRDICLSHGISICNEKGIFLPLETLVAKLKSWYERVNYFDSEFCVFAIRNTIDIFAKYNNLRNSRSAAHPNQLLKRTEAEYAVKIMADTLMFIDSIEKAKFTATLHRDNNLL